MKKESCSSNGNMKLQESEFQEAEFQKSELENGQDLLGNQRCARASLPGDSFTLSDSQAQLLHRYLDGECSYLARFSARRLLQKNSEARLYFHTLRSTAEKIFESTAMKVAALERESLSTEQMWDRIQRRIEAEERASVLLGERNIHGKASPVARMTREVGRLSVLLEAMSERFVGRKGSVFGGMAALTACCVLVVWSFSTADLAYEMMPNPGEGDVNAERSLVGDDAGLSLVESSTTLGSESSSRNEIRILPFSRSLPIDFVSSRPNSSRRGRHMTRELSPWNTPQMSFESYAGDSAEDYPLTAGTFDPFSFDDLLGQAYENNSSEAEAHWGTSQPPQVAVSGNYHVGGEGVGSSATIRNPTAINRSTSSPVILQEPVIPSTNFASR